MRKALYTLFISLCAASAWANPFGGAVVNYNPGPGFFNYVGSPYVVVDKCLGEPLHNASVYDSTLAHPYAIADTPCNATVITLGDRRRATGRGTVTISFDSEVTDNPRNPYGLDFIVFSNAYFVGGNPAKRWQELAFVEISQDGVNWYLIKQNRWPSELVKSKVVNTVFIPGDTGTSSTVLRGYAECTPTLDLPQFGGQSIFSASRTPEELYTIPDRPSLPQGYNALDLDLVSGGGDAFDIADAVLQLEPGVPALVNGQPIPAGISSFRFIRLTDALEGDAEPGLGEVSAEIEAVSAVRPAVTLGEAKNLPEGGYALVTEAVVTGVFPNQGCFFVESPDRSAALRVNWDSWAPIDRSAYRPITLGDRLTLTGHITRGNGGFTLPDPMFSVTSEANELPAPVGMPLKSLGLRLAYGLRVRTWGRVTDAGDGFYCTVSDGERSVKVVSDEYPFEANQGSFITLTGVCDRGEDGTTLIHLVDPSDISAVEP